MELNTNRLIEIFLELIQIEAVSCSEKPVAEYISNFATKLDIQVLEDQAGQIVGGNTGNLIMKVPGNHPKYTMCLVAHMDTIQSTWGVKPIQKNGIIKSDGTTILGADNRAGISVILFIIETFKKNNYTHSSFETVFTIGEETGLFGSTNLDLNLVNSDTMYVLDSSADPGAYVLEAPTAREFEIKINGRPAHAAVNPEEGINAIAMAAEYIKSLNLGKLNEDTTFNIGKICGGEANNVIPEFIKITGEIRSLNPEDIENIEEKLQQNLEKITREAGGNYSLDIKTAFPGFRLCSESQALCKITESMKKFGLKPKPLRYRGGSDANIFNNRGITAVNLGIGAKNPHSVNEYIKIEDMHVIAKMLIDLIRSE